jgi:hypothetical protein
VQSGLAVHVPHVKEMSDIVAMKKTRIDRKTEGVRTPMKRKGFSSIEKRTMAGKAAFLRAVADKVSIARCARLAGIDRTTHYQWLAQDAKYKAAFYLAEQMAKDAVYDDLVRRGRVGVFEPHIYKGEFCYERCKRMLCTLADGTSAFEDELPKDARVIERHMVTARGRQIGVYKQDWRALATAFLGMPEGYGGSGGPKGKKGTHSAGRFPGVGPR